MSSAVARSLAEISTLADAIPRPPAEIVSTLTSETPGCARRESANCSSALARASSPQPTNSSMQVDSSAAIHLVIFASNHISGRSPDGRGSPIAGSARGPDRRTCRPAHQPRHREPPYGIDVDEQKEFHGPRTSISKRNSRAQVFSFEQPLPQGTPTVSAEPGPGLRGASALQTADRSMLPWPA